MTELNELTFQDCWIIFVSCFACSYQLNKHLLLLHGVS